MAGIGKYDTDARTEGRAIVDARKTILIFSPDLNLCFSLSMLFQDRFHVVTTTDLAMVEPLAAEHAADLMIADAVPSERLMAKLDDLQSATGRIPIILLYVYNARDVALDRDIRAHVDSVFYKPVEINAVSRRIEELLTV
jgi:response regulator RpfG family c-di-GMP phosphodiesterase